MNENLYIAHKNLPHKTLRVHSAMNTCSTSLPLSVSLALVSDDVPVYYCQSHWCQTMYQSAAVGVTGVSTCTTTSLLLSMLLVSVDVPVYCC